MLEGIINVRSKLCCFILLVCVGNGKFVSIKYLANKRSVVERFVETSVFKLINLKVDIVNERITIIIELTILPT